MASVAAVRPNLYDGVMPRQFQDPDRLTARQAIEMLDITRWKFFDLVNKGVIHRYIEEPYALGYYKRNEIEAYGRKIRAANAGHNGE